MSNPPKEFQFKKGVSGNRKGRPPKCRKGHLVIHIISKFQNTPTAYREGGRTKRASRPELALKKLVNSAIEGDVRSTDNSKSDTYCAAYFDLFSSSARRRLIGLRHINALEADACPVN